jgi:hypothetical protein
MQRTSRRSRRFLVRCVVALCLSALRAHAQSTGAGLQETIDDDLQAQAQVETDAGNKERAIELLNELVKRDPRRAGALLDVAILYCQLGERDLSLASLSHLEKSYTVPPAIEKLIGFYKTDSCAPAGSRPRLSMSVGIGATSNANFGTSNPFVTFAPGAPFTSLELAPESLAHGDSYIESAIAGELPIAMLPNVTLLAALANRQYRSMHAFDQRTATFGFAHSVSVGRGEIDNQLLADTLWLGTHVYQRDVNWRAGYWGPPVAAGNSLSRAGVDLTLNDAWYPGNALYDSLRAELRIGFNARIGERTTVLLFAGPAWDEPHSGRPGGARHGYTASLTIDYDMTRYGQLEAILQQRTLNDTTPYDPLFFGDVRRRQSVQAASLRYVYPLNRSWSLYALVSTQRVDDSISLFSYTTRSGSAGITWKY